MYVENDSSEARMRSAFAAVFANAACDPSPTGERISTNMIMDERDELPSKPITAEQEFTFSMQTIEVRPGANAGCSVTASFTPRANETYDARLYTRGNSARCEMVVVDKNNHEVALSKPYYSCVTALTGRIKNGLGWYRPISVSVTIVR